MIAIGSCLALFAVQDDPLDYGRDVRPILTEHCIACHGPDQAARQGNLRLDDEDAARAAGVFDGDPSELEFRIAVAESFERMPPPPAGQADGEDHGLDDDDVLTLTRWVREGALYDRHWAFDAPTRPALPDVPEGVLASHPIDRFVRARLHREGLEPAPEADRRTLARRLSLDLTGLPPDPVEVEAFVHDEAPDAYERLVERWMAGPAWGEHRARHWLDLARYADTHGIHFDNYRDIWPYRDWVIDAFTRDMPFDRFSIEQLAGDLLEEPTIESRVATGFLRCNITTNEGGLIDEEYKVLYARDRTETFGQVWLGLSVGCAVCHDEMFDPLTQAEFYGLSAFFDNTTVPVRDGNVQDPPPTLRVTPPGERARRAELAAALAITSAARDARTLESAADFARWISGSDAGEVLVQAPTVPPGLVLGLDEGQGRDAGGAWSEAPVMAPLDDSATWIQDGPFGPALQTDGGALAVPSACDFEFDEPFTSSGWVRVEADEPTGALWSRMDSPNAYRGWDVWLQGRRVGLHLIHHFPDNWLKVVAKEPLPPDRWVHVAAAYDGSGQASGVQIYYDGVRQELRVEADRLDSTIRTDVPFRLGTRTGGSPTSATFSHLRVDRGYLSAHEIAAQSLHAPAQRARQAGLEALDPAVRERLHGWWLNEVDAAFGEQAARAHGQELAIAEIDRMSPVAHVFAETDGAPMAFVLHRGEYDQRRAPVSAGTPSFLLALDGVSSPEQGLDRLALARWLFDPAHPLTSRVAVNRFWQELFGVGLVETSDDFGLAGATPSHPELLDWLAVEFRESGWSVKHLFRRIVTSTAYRQSARTTPAKLAADPDNRLLSRGPRFRMDAETLRDTALAASGLLVRDVGGPSVKPYQPPGVWEAVAMRESNTHRYVRDDGPRLWRRSLYTFWKRSAPPASMEIFDAPSRELCTVRRVRTNTPLQALVTLNDPQFVEAARALATRALDEREWADERLDWMMLRLNARRLDSGERAICAEVLADLLEHFAEDSAAAVELLGVGEIELECDSPDHVVAAWTMLANMLMNLDETVTK